MQIAHPQRLVFCLSGLMLLLSSCSSSDEECYAHLKKHASAPSPYADGNAIVQSDADYFVSSVSDFWDALDEATEGEIIYVNDEAALNLSGYSDLCINEGVTLASGGATGSSNGALIYTNTLDTPSLFQVCGSKVRITGLRIKGPDTEIRADCTCGDCRYCIPESFGIVSGKGFRYLEIDNNEIYGWSHAAVYLEDYHNMTKSDRKEILIHRNYFHHNRRYGLGYGVKVGLAYATITKNVFDENRHAIAGRGPDHSGYEASYNLVLEHNSSETGHSFDMHREGHQDSSGPAGEWIYIHGNTFFYKDDPAMKLRGLPTDICVVTDNAVAHHRSSEAFIQTHVFGNFSVYNNSYKQKHDEVALADFDGDGITDVFMATGKTWYSSRGGSSPWKYFNTSDTLLSNNMVLADFTGDGRADVFKCHKGYWYISNGGVGKWEIINSSIVPFQDLRFADFTGDGRADVFKSTSGIWYISDGGTGKWEAINSSIVPLQDLRFVNIVGDKRADVFKSTSGKWYVSDGGVGQWKDINSSIVPLKDLRFADFTGDGRADVFKSTSGKWYISDGGVGQWDIINTSNVPIKNLRFGDFTGDGRADVFKIIGSKWYISSSGTGTWTQINAPYDGDLP